MAEEAPSPPPAEPEPEPARLKRKVETLERELRSCQRRVREVERLYRSAESSNRELRVQVEELSKILHCGIKNDIKKSDVEVQTDDWAFSGCYYQTNCSSGRLPDKGADFSAETLDSREQSPAEDAAHADAAVTGAAGCGPGEHQLASGSQEAALAAAAGEAPLEGSSLAESLRAAAEAAVSQTGFSYDENTGLYFDHTTGFYYDSENQLYYDPSTGFYYYCDVDSGRYQFHSRVELQPYQNPPTRQSKDKKWKKRRKGPDGSAASEEKDLTSADQKAAGVDHASSGEGENFTSVRKKPKTGVGHQHSPPPLSVPVGESSAGSPGDHMVSSAAHDGGRVTETDSEPEEGEITDSHSEASCEEEDCPSGASASAAESEEEEERIWPPCIRVIVIRSPVLQTGSLFIITAVSPATIGREKDMEHTLRIPEVGVSKFHAEIHFDHDLQSYVLVDQGSQNGTTVNGKQILQPKTKCDPYVLEHGDEVRIGETVLSLHIHPGSDTCDGCEPGQVRAHLRLDKKLGSCVGPALSKEEKELERRKELKKIRVKYGLQNTDYEDEKALKNPKYKDRAGKRREQVGSEGTFLRDDAPASVHSEITDSNKGRKMLERMGWKEGEGLGKDSSGLLTPMAMAEGVATCLVKDPQLDDMCGLFAELQLQLRQARAGLGSGRPSSVEDVQLLQSKTKKNWDKARERFAENFPETQPPKDPAAPMPWVKGAAE